MEIKVSEFTTDVNNGMSKKDLIEKYQISDANVKKIAKSLGLKIKKAMKPKFTLVYDTNESINA